MPAANIARNARQLAMVKLRIWGSGVRISPGAPVKHLKRIVFLAEVLAVFPKLIAIADP
jgi:hypothetical protein